MNASSLALRVQDVHKHFGGVPAVTAASFDVAKATIHALIGPNGAGKTTMINVITGYLNADRGSVELAGTAIQHLPVAARVRKGLARTFQIRQLFGGMTAFDNVLMGCHQRLVVSSWRQRWVPGPAHRARRALAAECDSLLALVGISRFRDVLAAHLPAGVQGRLEVARALATQPSVLLLDEPCAGLSGEESQEVGALLRQLARPAQTETSALAILVVEHNMPFVLDVADHVTVMDAGEIIASGKPQEIRADPRVIEAYLGGVRDARATS